MVHRFGEDLWYLLTVVNGMGYMVLLIVGMIWVRLLLHVVEDAIAPLRRHPHKFVHPLRSPSDASAFGKADKSTQPATTRSSGPRLKRRKDSAQRLTI